LRALHFIFEREISTALMNPLIDFPQTAHGSLDFAAIAPAHFIPALDHWIAVAEQRQEAIVVNPDTPTFANTIEALEFSTNELNMISSCFFNLNSAETNSEIQEIARSFSPKLTAFSSQTLLNEPLFLRIKAVVDQAEERLTAEQERLLKETYEGYVRNGALLQGADRDRLKALNERMSTLSLTFGEHVLAETQAFEYHTEDLAVLAGLPEDVVDAAAELATSKDKTGYLLGLDMPTYISVMKYAENAALRKHFYTVYASRGAQANEHNNEEVIREIVNLRLERANLLGFESHAALTLSKRMAKTPETVFEFLDHLKTVATPAAQKDLAEVSDFAASEGAEMPLQAWDFSYWAEKLKKATLSLDDQALKPYFQLENVLDGAFTVAGKLFGLTFKPTDAVSVYHEDVDAYEVFDREGTFLSLFYADFFPRDGKRAGAWMTSYRSMYAEGGTEVRPHISIVCNFTKPTATKPSLLTFNEVTTLFHEFGHALHGMMAKGTYPSLTGTSVYWDFVELPSQIMENWCYQPEALALFAKHYETGEILPQSFIDKIKESQTFLEGYMTLRQLNFGYLDLSWHARTEPFTGSVAEHEAEALKETSLFESLEGTLSSTAFSHIFQGGYSAGYYSYKWAEVLDADAFERFEEEGIFNEAVATDFAVVLSSGGTVAPDELYKKFRGREPKVDALLKRAGIAA
jgi:Zn-dependent oligopeptidase